MDFLFSYLYLLCFWGGVSFGFGTTPGFLLILCSGITSGKAQETISNGGN